MKHSRAVQRSGYNCESTWCYNYVSQTGPLGYIWCPCCFMILIADIDDPFYFLLCRHFSIEQHVFYILELAALRNNADVYLINEIRTILSV
jgi:hypothetical protein